MIFQSYRECFILLNHVPCVGCRVYTVSKRRKERKKIKPTCHFFSDSNSTVEWRAEYWDTSTQLEWRFKEMEGTRNRLLQPPPHGILRVRKRRKKKSKNKTKIKSTLMSLSCINYPWVICHPLSKTFLLLNQEAMVSTVWSHGNCDSKLSLSHPGIFSASQPRHSSAQALVAQASPLLQPGCGA